MQMPRMPTGDVSAHPGRLGGTRSSPEQAGFSAMRWREILACYIMLIFSFQLKTEISVSRYAVS
jgi:hypothetical protein